MSGINVYLMILQCLRLVYNSANLYTYLAHIDTQLERIYVCDVDIMQKKSI